jgi:hypothetical protein
MELANGGNRKRVPGTAYTIGNVLMDIFAYSMPLADGILQYICRRFSYLPAGIRVHMRDGLLKVTCLSALVLTGNMTAIEWYLAQPDAPYTPPDRRECKTPRGECVSDLQYAFLLVWESNNDDSRCARMACIARLLRHFMDKNYFACAQGLALDFVDPRGHYTNGLALWKLDKPLGDYIADVTEHYLRTMPVPHPQWLAYLKDFSEEWRFSRSPDMAAPP